MEMEMRATEDIDIGTDITPSLIPLSFSLYNSHLHTHCSACFSLLPSPTLSYCSPRCSSLHFSSADHHLFRRHPSADSSDLLAALRLLLSHCPTGSGRIAGLLSNRHKLTSHNRSSDDDDVSEKIRIGAEAVSLAIATQRGEREPNDAVLEEATVALCAVLTNAVEVQDNEGRPLGIAVYDPTFSWINHSCSPNACYRFEISSSSSPSPSGEAKLRIAPFTRHSQHSQQGSRAMAQD